MKRVKMLVAIGVGAVILIVVAAVLWIVDLLPAVLEELDAIHLAFGKTSISLRTLIEGCLSSGLVLVVALWVSSTLERKVLSHAISDLSMRRVAVNAMRAVLLLMGLSSHGSQAASAPLRSPRHSCTAIRSSSTLPSPLCR